MSRIWDDRLAEVWAAPGKSGAGVIVGTMAVVTARHVVEGALSGAKIFARAVRPGDSTTEWVRMVVAAEDQDWDLALLVVDSGDNADPSNSMMWSVPLSPSPVIARLGTSAEPGCEAVGFPQGEIQRSPGGGPTTATRQTEQARGTLLPAGQGKSPVAPDRSLPRRWLPLDVETATPATSEGWGGMSGAGVALANGHLAGIVVAAELTHQQRRLYVVPLASAIDASAALAGAMRSAVTSGLIMEAPTASYYKRILQSDCLGPDGQPLRVADAGLEAYGVKVAAIAGESPFLDYVPRDRDQQLEEGVRRAISEHRMLLVVGGSAVGKSRSAAEVARRLLGQRRLLCPRPAFIARLNEFDIADLSNALVWLDDVERYDDSSFRDVVDRLLSAGAAVVGTIRRSELEARMPKGELRNPLGDALTNAAFVVQVSWSVKWSDEERARVSKHVKDPALLRWVAAGNSPSTWVVAGPSLVGKLRLAESDDENPARHALVLTVLDWYRTGIGQPIPKVTAADLIRVYIAEDIELRDLDDSFRWAVEPVIGASQRTAQSLLTDVEDGTALIVHDYVQDVDTETRISAVPDQVWTAALDHVTSDSQREVVGVSAALQGNLGVASAAWIPLAEQGHTDVMANLLLALRESDPRAARRWGEAAAQAGDPVAMYNLGYLLADSDPTKSREWYERAADAGHLGAMTNLALMLKDTQPQMARRWYERAIDGGDVAAMNNLAFLLKDSEPGKARSLWEEAAQAGNPEAMTSLGRLLVESDPDGTRRLWEQAADQGHAGAMYNLGLLLEETAPDEARMWLRRAASAGVSAALIRLGILAVGTDPNESRNLWTSAAGAGDVDAMFNLWLLLRSSEPDEARTWLETAAAAGSTTAMYTLGYLLKDADPDGARSWLEQAAQAGSTDAMTGLGILLSDSDPAEAKNWRDRAAKADETRRDS